MADDMNERAQKVLLEKVNKIKEKRLNAERDEIIKVRKESNRVDLILSTISFMNLFVVFALSAYIFTGFVNFLVISILLSCVTGYLSFVKLDADLDYEEFIKEYKVLPYGRYRYLRIVNMLPLLLSSFLGVVYMMMYYPL